MNTALYVLRAVQCGLSVSDLDQLSIGLIFDMFTESKNDDYDYDLLAEQSDIDRL